jgi:serine/threonine-protein kinase
MQFIDGEDLKHLIGREAPLPSSRVREIASQVLDGLQAIHAAGIVHRDIKPQNVLIGRDGIARVTDFGVAHVHEDTGLTTAGTTVGTAAYMAPEQAQGGRVTQAADIYAVGVMLYEMMTGYLPFNAPTAMATMLEHIQNDPVPPSQRLPGRGITPAMDSVVLQALAKGPERRFNSARAMKQAVRHVFGSGGGAQTTVVTPAAPAQVVRRRPSERRMDPPPYVPAPASAAAWEARAMPRDEGAGVNGAVKALLTVILLGLFAVGAWFLFDNFQEDDPGGAISPTETVQATDPPAPTATEAGVIEPINPTDTPPTETPQPTETPAPTSTPEPTPFPTQAPLPTSTPEQGIIEPLDITPIPTQSG